MVWGDVEITGLGSDVSINVLSFLIDIDPYHDILSFGTFGESQAISRSFCSFVLVLRLHWYSIMARPLRPTGNKFGLGITGQNFDPTDLADPAKVVEFFKQETGRIDLEFGDFTWLSYFKYVDTVST